MKKITIFLLYTLILSNVFAKGFSFRSLAEEIIIKHCGFEELKSYGGIRCTFENEKTNIWYWYSVAIYCEYSPAGFHQWDFKGDIEIRNDQAKYRVTKSRCNI